MLEPPILVKKNYTQLSHGGKHRVAKALRTVAEQTTGRRQFADSVTDFSDFFFFIHQIYKVYDGKNDKTLHKGNQIPANRSLRQYRMTSKTNTTKR